SSEIMVPTAIWARPLRSWLLTC
ncbi:uncharacterized protein METZ01_LOCUS353746, partial [marine metagenome]